MFDDNLGGLVKSPIYVVVDLKQRFAIPHVLAKSPFQILRHQSDFSKSTLISRVHLGDSGDFLRNNQS